MEKFLDRLMHSIGLFKMPSSPLVVKKTTAPGQNSLTETDISHIHPFALLFLTSINVYKTNGILTNGSRATQNGVPAYGASALS